MKLPTPVIAFLLGAACATGVALQCRPAPSDLGEQLGTIGDTAAAVADREGLAQAAIDSAVAALQPKIRYVDSVRWIARHYIPPIGDSLSIQYWRARATAAEALVELSADAGEIDGQVHRDFQSAIDDGKASSGRLRAMLYQVRDSLQEKIDDADALEASLAQARKTLRFGVATQAVVAGDCAVGVAGVTMVGRRSLLGIEAEGQVTAGAGAAACRGGERSTIGPAIALGLKATK
jgi:hypothetical protein